MRKQNAVCLAVLVAGLMAGRALAGSLDPTNAPGSTMHTLEEIYQKVNNLVVYNNGTIAIPKTGQATSYQVGDDGTYKKGVAWLNPRFTVQGDTNCVTDNLTGLVWTRSANLGAMSWSNAVVYCENLTYGGTNDWRLPNVRELQSLIDYGRSTPALCNTAGTGQWTANNPFVGVQANYYWSSTSIAGDTVRAWIVYIGGNGCFAPNIKTDDFYYVWPVRGGQ